MRLYAINEAIMGSRQYKIPQDVRQLMADFYLLDLLQNGLRHVTSDRTDKVEFELGMVERTLLPYLREHMLDKAGYSIASELRHVFDQIIVAGDDDDDAPSQTRYGMPGDVPTELVVVEWLESLGVEPNAILILVNAVTNDRRPTPQETKQYFEEYARAGAVAFDSDQFEWSEGYGGPPWQAACKTWLELKHAAPNETRMRIDRIYQLQHNNGNLLDKNPEYVGPWLRRMLDLKYVANSPEQLIPFASPFMRTLAGFVLHNRYGRGADSEALVTSTQQQFMAVLKSVVQAAADTVSVPTRVVEVNQQTYQIILGTANNAAAMAISIAYDGATEQVAISNPALGSTYKTDFTPDVAKSRDLINSLGREVWVAWQGVALPEEKRAVVKANLEKAKRQLAAALPYRMKMLQNGFEIRFEPSSPNPLIAGTGQYSGIRIQLEPTHPSIADTYGPVAPIVTHFMADGTTKKPWGEFLAGGNLANIITRTVTDFCRAYAKPPTQMTKSV
jgi:hypothetical protein